MLSSCPTCNTPLRLFTPRESLAHINACLDAANEPRTDDATASPPERPVCAVCNRDLTPLTEAARHEHANRCADSTLPLGREPQRPTRPSSRSAAASRPAASTADPHVARLLQLLGLQRYAARLATEEIDLEALRLLSDSDLAALRIPDHARRRIAEAMHSVPILAQIAEEELANGAHTDAGASSVRRENGNVEESADAAPAPTEFVATQQFQTSRLAQDMGGHATLLGEKSSDEDEYFGSLPAAPAPMVGSSVAGPASRGEGTPGGSSDGGQRLEVQNETTRRNKTEAAHDNFDDSSSTSSREQLQDLMTGGAKPHGSGADSESLSPGSLSDIDRELGYASQIALESRLRRWRQRREKRERVRHKREMEFIRSSYEKMQKRICTRISEDRNAREQSPHSRECIPDVSNAGPEPLQISIDLTNDPSDEDEIQVVKTPPASQRLRNTCDQGCIVVLSSVARRKVSERDETGSESIPAADNSGRGTTGQDAIFISSGSEPRARRRPKFRPSDGEEDAGVSRQLHPSSPESERDGKQVAVLPTSCGDNEQATPGIRSPNRSSPAHERTGQEPDALVSRPSARRRMSVGVYDLEEWKTSPHYQRTRERSALSQSIHSVEDKESANSSAMKHSLSNAEDSGDTAEEEVLDLVDSGKENGATQIDAGAPVIRNAVSQTQEETQSEAKAASQGDEATGPSRRKPPSRLKKPRKVNNADVLNAIRMNKCLYSDILMMDAVPFERILEAVRGAGVNVSKKALTDLLHEEGVAFKGEAAKDVKTSTQYFKRLNCEFD